MKINVYLNDSISPHMSETHVGGNIRPERDDDGVLSILTHDNKVLGVYNRDCWSHVVVNH